MCEFVYTRRSEQQLLAFWCDVTARFCVGFFCRNAGLFCGYTGLFFEDVHGSCADKQTPYIHRPLLQKCPAQQRLILERHLIIQAHCNTLQHTATHCITLLHNAIHCNALHHPATPCNTLQHTATPCNTLQHTATHCNTLQHTATHCNTLNNKRALQKQSSFTKET